MQIVQHQTHRFTKAEYHQMAAMGWFNDSPVELLEGEILDMPAPGPPHCTSVECVCEVLRAAIGAGYWVRGQMPLDLGPHSEPLPDVAVVPGRPRDYPDHPTTALLVIEISDSSLSMDRTRKASLYARVGIADYWIVNLFDRQLEVYRQPGPDPSQFYGAGYTSQVALGSSEFVTPLAFPSAQVAVGELFT